jgi:hypothetical protein
MPPSLVQRRPGTVSGTPPWFLNARQQLAHPKRGTINIIFGRRSLVS